MKTIWKITLGLLALSAAVGCSDSNDGPTVPVADKDETRYLRISIVSNSDNTSRADLAVGTGAENTVKSLDFYFYDAQKQYVAHVRESEFDADDSTVSSALAEKIVTSRVPIELTQGNTIPSYVIVAVNAVSPLDHCGKSMTEAQSDLLSSIYRDNGANGEFGMSNSVYYGYDNVTSASNTLIMATPFDSKILKTKAEMDEIIQNATKSGATSAEISELESITVNCYVERYAAKIILKASDEQNGIAVQNYVTDGITLKFVPEGWAFNNFEKDFYFIKSYRQSSDESPDQFSSFDDMNNTLKWTWNEQDKYRSYWTRTPTYYDQQYPVVADDILDVIGGSSAYDPAANMSGYPYHTYYESYENLTKTGGSLKSIGSHGYYSESTVGSDVLTGDNMPLQHNVLAAIPSVIVVGHYEVSYGGTTVSVGNDSPTFYTYGTTGDSGNETAVIYTAESDKGGASIGNARSLLDYMLSTQSVIFYKESSEASPVYDLTTVEGVKNLFSIEHPAKDSRTNLKIASSIVTLQHGGSFDESLSGKLYFHDPESTDHEDLQLNTEANVTRANRLLFETLGGAMAYNHGRAFFSAPIQHLGWQRDSNTQKNLSQSEWDWTKMLAGDFGVVRNHVYTLSVNRITGLGTGILDYGNPILPPSEHVAYNMRFSIQIQKWAIVPTQEIDW